MWQKVLSIASLKPRRSPTTDLYVSSRLKATKISPAGMLESLEHLNLTGSVQRGEHIASGGYSDVYTGIWRPFEEEESGFVVALKELRIHLRKEKESFVKVTIVIFRPSVSNHLSRCSLEKYSPGRHFVIRTSYD